MLSQSANMQAGSERSQAVPEAAVGRTGAGQLSERLCGRLLGRTPYDGGARGVWGGSEGTRPAGRPHPAPPMAAVLT